MKIDCAKMSDEELVASLKCLVGAERENLIEVLRHLAELDTRELAEKTGHPSLFVYCVKELRYSESEAYRRIHAMRAAKKFRVIHRLLASGRLALSTVSLLAPHLTKENRKELIRRALGLSTREVQAMVADRMGAPRIQDSIRFIGKPPGVEAIPENRDELPLFQAPAPEPAEAAAEPREAPSRSSGRIVRFSFTADEEFLGDFDRAKELLWHKHPTASQQDIFAEALQSLLARIDLDRRAAFRGSSAVAETRRIPMAVRKAVWKRDKGSCRFEGPGGIRCETRRGLEFDHVTPWAKGGRSDNAANIRLLCRKHNQLEARRLLGDGVVAAALRRKGEGELSGPDLSPQQAPSDLFHERGQGGHELDGALEVRQGRGIG